MRRTSIKWLSSLLVVMLLLTSVPLYAAAAEAGQSGTEAGTESVQPEEAGTDSVPPDNAGTDDDQAIAASLLQINAADSGTYVRLKSRWQRNYLYEDSNGVVRYGFTDISDKSSHWQLEDQNGNTRLKNRQTGHYMTLAEVGARRNPVTSRAITDSKLTDQWIISDMAGSGFMIIRSASDMGSNYVLHVEDQLGFAQASRDIPVGFESPQWTLESVAAEEPVRIFNEFRAGQYLFETAEGAIHFTSGANDDPDAVNLHSQWYIEEDNDSGGNSIVRLRNRATGHYIVQADEVWKPLVTSADSSGANSEWILETATTNANNKIFRAAQSPANVLNTQFDDVNIRANEWAQPEWGSAQWKVVKASDTRPVRIVNFTTEKLGVDYWYEDQGTVKYGPLGTSNLNNLAYQWVVEDFDGAKRFRNMETGRYAVPGTQGGVLQSINNVDDTAPVRWNIEKSTIYDDYVTIKSVVDSVYYPYKGGVSGSGDVLAGNYNPETDEAQWLIEDLTINLSGEAQYYQIQNLWKTLSLYEDENGFLKYGNVKAKDERGQWEIERYEGRKRIKNRATGHYINLDPQGGSRILVSDVAADWIGAKWVIEDQNGIRLIHNVQDRNDVEGQQKYINTQNFTKYAEYGVINPGWSSPKWVFTLIRDEGPEFIRLKNEETGSYLLDESTDNPNVGLVKYGDVPATDLTSVWYLEAANGPFRLKNAATSRYISMEHIAAATGGNPGDEPTQPMETIGNIDPSWGSILWRLNPSDTDGLINLLSGWTGEHFLYTAGGGITKMSNKVAALPSAKFTVEATDRPEQPIPSEPVRLKNADNGQYLYESESGVVMYGPVDASNGYSHWTIEDVNGVKRIVNRVTGHSFTTPHDYKYITSGTGAGPSSEWALENISGNIYLIRTLNPSFNDEYLNVAGKSGYVERGLVTVTDRSLHWALEVAPENFETPAMGEPRNHNTSTPLFSDTNYVTIVSKETGEKLVELGGTVSTMHASDDSPSAQWLIQDFNGRKVVQNRGTGRYLTDALKTTDLTLGDDSQQWTIEDRLGYKTLQNAIQPEGKLYDTAFGTGYGDVSSIDSSLWKFKPIVSNVKYEAEEAFIADGAAVSTTGGTYSGSGFVSGLDNADSKITFTVNAQAAGNYEALLNYRNPGETLVYNVTVNGLQSAPISLSKATGWSAASLQLQLRSGINTVTLQKVSNESGGADIDFLQVKASVAKAYRGATLPYITYEAEHSSTNGTLIGPSRLYLDVAAEASGRQAVTLEQTGDYVQFELAEPANALTLRFSMPDSADGKGINETLSLYVNGQFKQKLQLTSKHAWEYGSYPWSNDPAQGSPHRFFDEAHALIGDVPAGAKIKLQKDAGDNSEYYTIDLVDMEQVALAFSQPAGYLSITDFGALSGDGIDDTTALNAAIDAAKAQNKGVWIPEGVFHFLGDNITLDQVTIRGAGMWHTTLIGARFIGLGTNIQVYDLLIDGDLNVRDDEASTHAFEGAFGKGSVIQNVWVEHSKTGLWLTKLKDRSREGDHYFDEYTNGLHMVGLRLRNLMADGINFCVGTQNSMMEQTDIRYPGDDGIAMWSNIVPSINNTARFNTVTLPWLANNIIVFGGHGNKIQDNVTKDTVTNGSGISVSTRFNPVPFSGTTIVERNTIIRGGSYDRGYEQNLGALWIMAENKDLRGDIIVQDNIILDSTYSGLLFYRMNGAPYSIEGVKLSNNVIDGAGTNGLEVAGGVPGFAQVDNLIIRNAKVKDVANTAASFSFNEINEGFAAKVKPFLVQLGNQGNSPFTIAPGTTAELKVQLANGDDATADAIVELGDNTITSITGNQIKGETLGTTTLTISVGGATRIFTITVKPIVIDSGPGEGGGTGGGSTPQQPKPEVIDTKANDAKLSDALKAGDTASFTTPADGKLSFSVKALIEAAKTHPNAVLVIQNGSAEYRFPVALVSAALTKAGVAADSDAVWTFAVSAVTGAQADEIRTRAAEEGLTLHGTPIDFTIVLTSGGRTINVTQFGTTFVTRTIQVSDTLTSAGATALVYDPATKQFRFVPALFGSNDKGTLATIKSASNSIYVVASYSKTFSDIAKHWAKADIELLSAKRIINGTGPDSFAPDKSVTRAEFAAMLVRSLGLSEDSAAAGASTFKDVKGNEWFAPSVRLAVQYGLLKGYSDGTFRPSKTITREEMAVMASNALKQFGSAPEGTISFSDSASISAWATEAVKQAVAAGIINGIEGNRFAPKQDSTRAQSAVILKRLLQHLELLDK
ncbi:S-layer homology domain-containing protein [Paenibacillus sp. NPDC058071]|uniref:S-layer homology domain-containing protein n=1 Tax=Paenibacillus sp. NPDC058071 TaxID=3346326 RepID=UPI0036DA71C9